MGLGELSPNRNPLALHVEDVEAARAALEERGVQLLRRHLRHRRLPHGVLLRPGRQRADAAPPLRAARGPAASASSAIIADCTGRGGKVITTSSRCCFRKPAAQRAPRRLRGMPPRMKRPSRAAAALSSRNAWSWRPGRTWQRRWASRSVTLSMRVLRAGRDQDLAVLGADHALGRRPSWKRTSPVEHGPDLLLVGMEVGRAARRRARSRCRRTGSRRRARTSSGRGGRGRGSWLAGPMLGLDNVAAQVTLR